MKDNSDLFFGDEKNRPKPQEKEQKNERADIVESTATTTKVTTEETSTTTTTTDEPTTTTEIKTTTSTTMTTRNDKSSPTAVTDESDEMDEKDQTLKALLEDEITVPSVLLVGKDKSECSSLVLIFHQLKFQFEENYNNLDKILSSNVQAIIFCSYSAYFNFKTSKNQQQFANIPTLLFPYFTEPAQFEIGYSNLEVVNVIQNSTYQFITAESKFNRIAKVSQVRFKILDLLLGSGYVDLLVVYAIKEPIEIALERISFLSNVDTETTPSATILSSVHINGANQPIILAYENSFIFSMEPGTLILNILNHRLFSMTFFIST